jgi:hypothetical protein
LKYAFKTRGSNPHGHCGSLVRLARRDAALPRLGRADLLDATGPPLAPPRVGQPDSVDVVPAYDVANPVCEG